MKNIVLWGWRVFKPIIQMVNLLAFPRYIGFIADWVWFKKMGGSAAFADWYPCLFDKVAETTVDKHYFYQNVWAAEKILQARPDEHIDIGSDVKFVGMLSSMIEVKFVDIRPFEPELDSFTSINGSILDMPFEDGSIHSISCLSVAEHIGLGRYGDHLDPDGLQKAIKELMRVLAPGGSLYFALPVGLSKVCFNAHRISSASKITSQFHELKLLDFSVVNDRGDFIRNAEPKNYDTQIFANGLFHFSR